MDKLFEVIITTRYGLNIQLSHSHKRRFFAHFMSAGQAELFAGALKRAIDASPLCLA